MARDRRAIAAPARLPLLAAAGLVLLLPCAPGASAQASATADPVVVHPGAPLILTYRVRGPPLVDVAAQEQVTCVLSGPGAPSSPCQAQGDLLDVRILPGEVVYSFNVTAPAEVGEYQATFTRARLVDIPGGGAAASVAFAVAPAPGAALVPAGSDVPAGQGGGDAPAEGPRSDAERWLVSSMMATGTLAVILVGGRWGLGGGPR